MTGKDEWEDPVSDDDMPPLDCRITCELRPYDTIDTLLIHMDFLAKRDMARAWRLIPRTAYGAILTPYEENVVRRLDPLTFGYRPNIRFRPEENEIELVYSSM